MPSAREAPPALSSTQNTEFRRDVVVQQADLDSSAAWPYPLLALPDPSVVAPVVYGLTGAAGLLGQRLASCLLRHGAAAVHLFDRAPTRMPPGLTVAQTKRVKRFSGDIRIYADVLSAFKGCDVVFHIASYGMSGREQVAGQLVRDINIKGTEHVINACKEAGVSCLVYTSTYNVAFGGANASPIKNGSCATPYLPLEKHCDLYSRTKSEAEQLVLGANRTKTSKGKLLLTNAIRPAGIYGDGEERHLPRIVSYIKAGLFSFQIGSPDVRVDFVYIENLVFAHVLAAHKLLSPGKGGCDGKGYFISDDNPINNFEFFRPIVEGLGYTFPWMRVPYVMMFYLAWLIEIVHRCVASVYNFQPLLTRAEVNKTSVTHYFSMEDARRELGYRIVVDTKEAMRRTVDFIQRTYGKRDSSGGKGASKLIGVIAFVALVVVLLRFFL